MPIIFVYTKTVDFNLASSMEKYLRGEDIDNSFVTVMAQDMPLVNEKIQEAFGREELIKTTLTKCTEALGGNMLKIMIHLISNNIKQNIIEENNNIMNQIVSKTRDNFIEKYNEYLGDGAFINHIINIFFNYLNEFYDKEQTITNKSKNLVASSDFISLIKNQYLSYKDMIKEIIEPIAKNQSEKFIDFQASFEKKNGNMKVFNRRNSNEYQKTIGIFLKKNYYFIVQNYIINQIINPSNNHLNDFLSTLLKEFSEIINSLANINDNTNPDCVLIKQHFESCFKIKLTSFSKNNNIINIGKDQLSNYPSEKLFQLSPKNIFVYEPKVYPLMNSNSFLYLRDEINNYNILEKTKINEINENWFIYKENGWKLLSPNLGDKLKNFLKAIKYQESSIHIDNNDKVFSTFQTIMRNDLINFFGCNLGKFFEVIYSYFSKQENYCYNHNNMNYKENQENIPRSIAQEENIVFNEKVINISNMNYDYIDNEIESIIINENIEVYYKYLIIDSLIKNSIQNSQLNLEQIKIIILGK